MCHMWEHMKLCMLVLAFTVFLGLPDRLHSCSSLPSEVFCSRKSACINTCWFMNVYYLHCNLWLFIGSYLVLFVICIIMDIVVVMIHSHLCPHLHQYFYRLDCQIFLQRRFSNSFALFLCFGDRASLCISGWPGTYRDPPDFSPWWD